MPGSYLIIRARDRTRNEFYADARDYKRGDVVAAYDADTRLLGGRVLTSPNYRILHAVNLPLAEALQLTAPQVLTANDAASEKTLARRGFNFDLDSALLPPALEAYLADDTRKEPLFVLNAPLAVLRTLRRSKVKVADPLKVSGT
jgi:hypothetical protein